jgi:hypothetical protein
MINPIQQPASSQIKPYQDQHSNQFEQSIYTNSFSINPVK